MLPTPPFFSNAQVGEGGMRNYRPNKGAPRIPTERHGTLRNLKERLNLAIAHWGPPYFGGFLPNYLIFLRTTPPFPDAHPGKAAKYETTDQTEGAAAHHGTPRNAMAPEGSPKFGYPALESAIFWRVPSELSNIFCAQRPPFPNTQMGKAAERATTDQNKATRRNATERYGTSRIT